jgi:hypothetical protein
MNKLIFFLFTLFYLPAYCQISNIEYYKGIKSAEQQILDSNFNSAVNIYYLTFQKNAFVYAKDAYTAAQTALSVDSFEKGFYFLGRGVKQGLTKEIIENSPILRKVKDTPKWISFLEIDYPYFRSSYLLRINNSVKSEIEEIISIDQYFTRKLNNSNFITYVINNRRWKKVVSKLVDDKLIKIIKTYGYPGEKLIGINAQQILYNTLEVDTISKLNAISKGFGYIGSSYSEILLIHYFSNRRDSSLISLLEKELNMGNIQPSQFAVIIDFFAKYSKPVDNPFYNQWHRNTSLVERNRINDRRTSIGLESYENLLLKEARNRNILKSIKNGNTEHIKLWTIWGSY